MTADQFKRLRRSLGLSVNDAARLLGFASGRMIRRIEAGTDSIRPATADKLRRLARSR